MSVSTCSRKQRIDSDLFPGRLHRDGFAAEDATVLRQMHSIHQFFNSAEESPNGVGQRRRSISRSAAMQIWFMSRYHYPQLLTATLR